MADRNAPASFTFEEWRVEFNELATDVGDIALLQTPINSTAVTDIVEAVNALYSGIFSTGYTLAADYGTSERVIPGDTITIVGTANEIETYVYSKEDLLLEDSSSIILEQSRDEILAEDGNGLLFEDNTRILFETNPTVDSKIILDTSYTKNDTVTIGLPNNVTVTNNLSVGGNVDVVGNITLGGNIVVGNQDTDSVDFNADIASNLVPNVDNVLLEDGSYVLKEDNSKIIPQDTVTYDLGIDGKPWGNLRLSGSIFDDKGNQFLLPTTAGTLSTTGFGIALAVALG